MQNLIGQSLGRYYVLEKLGEGGMATVYKAYDTRLEREVALKVIRKEAFGQEFFERILQRFEREAKAMAKLSHANIVKIHDYGEYEGSPYLVMELLTGGTLKEKIGSPIPWAVAIRIIEPIARALAYAHDKGILHRDVKPSNILITENNEPILTDFGTAKLLDLNEGQTLTGTGVGVGTPEYMAPEQGMANDVDGRTDVYSLGIVLYETITSRKPFTADTPFAVLIKQVNDPLPNPHEYIPDLPDPILRMIIKALAKNPSDRYQNMKEFAVALQNLRLDNDEQNSPIVFSSKNESSINPSNLATVDYLISDSESHEGSGKGKSKQSSFPSHGLPGKKSFQFSKRNVGIILGGLMITTLIVVAALGGFNSRGDSQPENSLTSDASLTPGSQDSIPSNDSNPTLVSEKDGMTMVFVPAGEFLMGSQSGKGEYDEFPNHLVYLDSYWIDQTEISNAMYKECVKANVCTEPYLKSSRTRVSYYNDPDYSSFPVVDVNWFQAQNYCDWAGRELPSEAQWEKASKGTDERIYPWGNELSNSIPVNFSEVYGDTEMVDSFPDGASPFGALNMAGNVNEWVNDWYGKYTASSENNPEGPSIGSEKVYRGGSWYDVSHYIRTTNREHTKPQSWNHGIGFRCAYREETTP